MGQEKAVGDHATQLQPSPVAQDLDRFVKVGRGKQQHHVRVWRQYLLSACEGGRVLIDRMTRAKVDHAIGMVREHMLDRIELEGFPIAINASKAFLFTDPALVVLTPA